MSTQEEKNLNDRKMTRRVLWKLDMHVLPPLAFVSDVFNRRDCLTKPDFLPS